MAEQKKKSGPPRSMMTAERPGKYSVGQSLTRPLSARRPTPTSSPTTSKMASSMPRKMERT
jgi:hypothetical protein